VALRSFTELHSLSTFAERFRYLALSGAVGDATFGNERWLNQRFYTSYEWKQIRLYVVARDESRDLGIPGYEIYERPIIHHMNPMQLEDIVNRRSHILDPEFLITTTHRTHNAIHYGDERQIPRDFAERRPGDTKAW
jgi:hypothetical protein